ncbi:MAG: phosphodiesterase [Acidimicrobiales bacterium]|nr:phosphodiesterase [Acidimicrobiales bacterium]
MHVVVLSDTHIRPGRHRRLPDAVYAELDRADAVLHAGDVVTPELLDELGGFAPVHAVLGSNDDAALAARLPETAVVDLGGVSVGMIHDSGPTAGRVARMRRRFPAADVVVFGHSHAPVDEVGVDGQRLFNPGSPTERRWQAVHTMGVLTIDGGRLAGHRVLPLG